MAQKATVFQPVENVSVWLDSGIMLKTNEPFCNPVEMSEEGTLALASLLIALVAEQRGEN